MREIKFRAWFNNTMIETMSIQEMIHQRVNTIPLKTLNNEVIFMQYTGLKDKNGVEIYEGDIVKDLRSPFRDARSYSKVFYQEDRGRFVFDGWEIPAGMSHTFEVIGNIYENSELLEGTK